MDMVFSGRAATGGGTASRSASSADAAAAGDDDLYAFYKQYIQSQTGSNTIFTSPLFILTAICQVNCMRCEIV